MYSRRTDNLTDGIDRDGTALCKLETGIFIVVLYLMVTRTYRNLYSGMYSHIHKYIQECPDDPIYSESMTVSAADRWIMIWTRGLERLTLLTGTFTHI